MSNPETGKQATGNRQQATELRKGADLAERLLRLAVVVLRVTRKLPRDQYSRHIVFQLLRSCTSAGANYEEARAAESRADFVHKVGVSAKEMRETIYWLKLIAAAGIAADGVADIIVEGCELSAILASSRRTARNAPF